MQYLEIEKGRAINSIKNYDHYLQIFAAFAKNEGVENPEKIDQDLIRKFRLALNRGDFKKRENVALRNAGLSRDPSLPSESLSEAKWKRESRMDRVAESKDTSRVFKELSKSTQNYYLIALRSFLKYLSKREIKTLAPEKIELAKTSQRQITFLEDDELEEILSKPDKKTIQGLRDAAILNLLFSSGLRVSELSNLKKDDINLEKSEFSVKGKGGKVRVVFIDGEARDTLGTYLRARTDKSDYLFVSYGHSNKQEQKSSVKNQSPITPRSIQRMIKKYALSAGITKNVTPHVLRHSFATDLLMGGADLRAVQALLGHSSISTTQIYTHITDQHLQDVHAAFHGRRRKNANELNDEKEGKV